MPEGEWAFLDSLGPRRTVTLRISTKAHLLLAAAATIHGTSATGIGTDVIESWAERFLVDHPDEIAEVVKAERERRDHG